MEVDFQVTQEQTRAILEKKFDARNVDACLRYFIEATEKYVREDRDGVALKAGKFVEAVTMALLVLCEKPLPTNARRFKAGAELKSLEQLSGYPETVRIVIPKACIYIFEIVNNRGGRHDSTDIDANEMDSRVVIPVMSWVLAEMVRFSSDVSDTAAAMNLIDEITNKVYPYFEEIDGRTYVNLEGAGAPDIALLLLYAAYPKAILRAELIDSVARHGHTNSAASMAILRMKTLLDDQNDFLKLRAIGREKAEALMKSLWARKKSKK